MGRERLADSGQKYGGWSKSARNNAAQGSDCDPDRRRRRCHGVAKKLCVPPDTRSFPKDMNGFSKAVPGAESQGYAAGIRVDQLTVTITDGASGMYGHLAGRLIDEKSEWRSIPGENVAALEYAHSWIRPLRPERCTGGTSNKSIPAGGSV